RSIIERTEERARGREARSRARAGPGSDPARSATSLRLNIDRQQVDGVDVVEGLGEIDIAQHDHLYVGVAAESGKLLGRRCALEAQPLERRADVLAVKGEGRRCIRVLLEIDAAD